MARVNVFLKDDLLKTLDTEAHQAGMSRSAFLQAALREYLETRRRAREEAEAWRRVDEACKRMDALAAKLGEWDPVRLIRRFRDSRSGGNRAYRRSLARRARG